MYRCTEVSKIFYRKIEGEGYEHESNEHLVEIVVRATGSRLSTG